jgi:hypothetical protein
LGPSGKEIVNPGIVDFPTTNVRGVEEKSGPGVEYKWTSKAMGYEL